MLITISKSLNNMFKSLLLYNQPNDSITIINHQENQSILPFEKQELANVWHLCLEKKKNTAT